MEVLGCTWTELLYNIVICQSSIIYERSLCGTQSPGSCWRELLIFTATAKKERNLLRSLSEAKLQSVKQPSIILLKLLCRKTKLDEIDELQGYFVVSDLKQCLRIIITYFWQWRKTARICTEMCFILIIFFFFAKTTLVGNDSCLWTSRLVKPVSLWHTMKKWISKTLYRPGLSWILWKIRNCEGGDHRLCDLLIFTSRWKLVINWILGGKLGGHGKVSPAGHGGHGRQRGEGGQQGLNLYSFSVCILWDHTIFIFYAILIF